MRWFFGAFLAFGCQIAGPVTQRVDSPSVAIARVRTPPPRESARDVITRAIAATVSVEASSKIGSGFLISPHIVATNLHVVSGENPDSILVKNQKGNPAHVTNIAISRPADLAVLTLDVNLGKPLELADSEQVHPGDRVFVVGNPAGLVATVSDGIVSAIRDIGDVHGVIQMTAPISHGSSGGPVIDEFGRVIGVSTFFLIGGQSLNFAMPSAVLARLALRSQNGELAPHTLDEFAKETRDTTETPIPAQVAGFKFGAAPEQARDLCPGIAFSADGRSALCSYLPVPIRFAKGPVWVGFHGRQVQAVVLTVLDFKDALSSLQAKYGPGAIQALKAGEWVEVNVNEPDLHKHDLRVVWLLKGGVIVMKFGIPDLITYIWNVPDRGLPDNF